MLFSGAVIVGWRDALATEGRILIGTRDKPGLEDGVLSLNHKGGDGRYSSATEFVCDQPDETIGMWKAALGLADGNAAVFKGHIFVVEDASVDTCLAVIALARRVDAAALPAEWISYAGLWERGFTEAAGQPEHSFGALLSSLAHVELQEDPDATREWNAQSYSRALIKGVRYAEGLIACGVSPFDIPERLPGRAAEVQLLHQQARSRLDYERLTYRRLAESAPRLQLAIHLAGSRRKALVDAILFSETMLTGTLKSFARTDPATFTGQGHAFMGLYRPALAGTGNDMTVSTKASAHLDLRALWLELERLEELRWAEFETTDNGFPRPRGGGKDRKLPSHDLAGFAGAVCHQPWYDEGGARTLLAAPRMVMRGENSFPGTLLSWTDLKEAIWRCYAPTMGLRVKSRDDGNGPALKLSENGGEIAALSRHLIVGSGLRIVDVVRVDGADDDIVLWSPTLSAMIASILATGRSGIDELPSRDAFDVMEVSGGVIVVSEHGVALIELSESSDFPASALREAAREIARTVAIARELETEIRNKIRGLAIKSVNEGNGAQRRDALKAVYSAKLRAREAWETATRLETNDLVRRFRNVCEQRWQAKAKFDNALAEIGELEDMILTTSEVRTNSTLNSLAIYGFPLSVTGNFLGGLLVLGSDSNYSVSTLVLAVYFGLSLAGIILLRQLSRRESESWRIEG